MTAISATFSDFRTVKSRKVAQLVLEVPIEQANAALKALGGVPQPDQEQWVGVAPLTQEAAEKPVERPKGGKLAQRAGILCATPSFHKWLTEERGLSVQSEAEAAAYVREYCGVSSRADLDHDEDAGVMFSVIYDFYRDWMRS